MLSTRLDNTNPDMYLIGFLPQCHNRRGKLVDCLRTTQQLESQSFRSRTSVALTMGTFQVETIIDAPVASVWQRLAGDIGTIAEWNPGVKNSSVVPEKDMKSGLGSQRHCDLGGGNYLQERVVKYEEEEAITFRIMETNMPFAQADIRFTLALVANEGTETTKVICSPDYKLKYGCLGELLDVCMVKGTYKKGMKNLLAGLKKDVEAKHH